MPDPTKRRSAAPVEMNLPDPARLAAVVLRQVDGTPVRLGEVVDRPTIIAIARYYGCVPCRAFLVGLEAASDELATAGIGVVGVGRAADYQAEHLAATEIGYPLLLDPDEQLYEALSLGRFGWWRLLDPRTWRIYARALRDARPGRVTNHPLQSPGVAVVDADLRLHHVHRGRTVGDYPPVGDLVDRVVRDLGR